MVVAADRQLHPRFEEKASATHRTVHTCAALSAHRVHRESLVAFYVVYIEKEGVKKEAGKQ